MSLFYIVDGYNVIRQTPALDKGCLRETRVRLFSFIENERPQGSLKNRLAVVFDGASDVFGCKENYSFEIVFSRGNSADERIVEMVSAFPNPKNIVVVTNDKELASAARRQGARIMSTSDFLGRKMRKKGVAATSTERASSEVKAELNIVEREKITEELKKIWLKN